MSILGLGQVMESVHRVLSLAHWVMLVGVRVVGAEVVIVLALVVAAACVGLYRLANVLLSIIRGWAY